MSCSFWVRLPSDFVPYSLVKQYSLFLVAVSQLMLARVDSAWISLLS